MIKDNIICFGYGDICVGATIDGYLTLRWFKPPQEIGSSLEGKEVEWLSKQIKLRVKSENMTDISKINKTNKQMTIGNYIFDFSNYNRTSVKVVKKHMKKALENTIFALAC
jgi:hypothetical protein